MASEAGDAAAAISEEWLREYLSLRTGAAARPDHVPDCWPAKGLSAVFSASQRTGFCPSKDQTATCAAAVAVRKSEPGAGDPVYGASDRCILKVVAAAVLVPALTGCEQPARLSAMQAVPIHATCRRLQPAAAIVPTTAWRQRSSLQLWLQWLQKFVGT